MITVFLSGSRKIGRLNRQIRERLDNIINQEFSVILGDANGADKAMQQYFAESEYRHVSIYCAGSVCRNNIGNWKANFVDIDPKLKGRDFYTQKDKEMAAIADYGLVLWDGKSPGSLNNIMELLKRNKKALVYFAPSMEFFTISHLQDAHDLLAKCDPESVTEISKKLKLPSLINEISVPVQQAMNF